jgi:hypothetical protein
MFTVGKRTDYFKNHDFKEAGGNIITKTDKLTPPVKVVGVVPNVQEKTQTVVTDSGSDVLNMIQDINKKG